MRTEAEGEPMVESAQPGRTLLTTEQAAEWIGGAFSPSTLAKWRTQGKGPPYYQPAGEGGVCYYDADELKAWFEGTKVSPAAE